MAEQRGESGCDPYDESSCCKVEAIVSVDERGQMVLPKDLRAKAKIEPGDKLAITSWEKNGEIYCISLVKSDDLAGMVKDMLGPIMGEVSTTNEKSEGEAKRKTKI
jgi:AbrB family looped-hinge helix DNA binding protein